MAHTENHDDSLYEDPDFKSKSQLKREMHALQKLAGELIALKPGQVAEVPMSDTLRGAIEESWRISQNEAKRRHMQYLGKLMRYEDTDQLQRAVDGFNAGSEENTRRLHIAERWRERLIKDDTAVTDFIAEYPAAEAQHLRNLVRNTRKELALERHTGQPRKLFRYLRELIDQAENP